MAIVDVRSAEDVRLEARAWFEDHWNPELTLAQWWDVFGTSGWAFPTWPLDFFRSHSKADPEKRPSWNTKTGGYLDVIPNFLVT